MEQGLVIARIRVDDAEPGADRVVELNAVLAGRVDEFLELLSRSSRIGFSPPLAVVRIVLRGVKLGAQPYTPHEAQDVESILV